MAQDGRFLGGGRGSEQQPTAPQPTPQEGAYQFQTNPAMQSLVETPPPNRQPVEESPGAPEARNMFQRFFGADPFGGAAGAVARAAPRAYNSIRESAIGWGEAVGSMLPEPVTDFMTWLPTNPETGNKQPIVPPAIPEEWIDATLLGREESTGEKMVTIGTQIAGTYLATGGTIAGGALLSTWKTRIALGGFSEMVALSNDEEMMLDMLPNDVLPMLQSQENDTFVEKELKQAIEGMVGEGIGEVIVAGVMRAMAKRRAKSMVDSGIPADDPRVQEVLEQGAAHEQRAMEAARKVDAGESRTIVEANGDGTYDAVLRPERPKPIPEDISFEPIGTRPGFMDTETGEILVDFNINTGNHLGMQPVLGDRDINRYRPVWVSPEFPDVPLTPTEAFDGKKLSNSSLRAPESTPPAGPKTTTTPEGKKIEFEDGTTFETRVTPDGEDRDVFRATFQTDDGPFSLQGTVMDDGVIHVSVLGKGATTDQAFGSLFLGKDAPGVGKVGIARLRKLGEQIAEVFPNATRVDGIHIGGRGAGEGRKISLPLRRQPKVEVEAPQRLTFNSEQEAHQVAATFEYIEDSRRAGPGLSDDDVQEWIEMADLIEEAFRTGDMALIDSAMANSKINIRYLHNLDEANASILAMSNTVDMGGKTVSNKEMQKLAQGVFPDMKPEDALAAARRLYGDISDMPQRLVALRAHLTGWGRQVRHLSKLVGQSTGAAKQANLDHLTRHLEGMVEFQYHLEGAASDAGRLLQSQKINPGVRELSPTVKAAQDAMDELDAAKGVVDTAKKNGDPAAIEAAEQQLEEAVTKVRARKDIESVVAEDVDLAAREAAGEVEEPPAASEAGQQGAETPPMSAEERMTALRDRLAAAVDEEMARATAEAAEAGRASPVAPTDRVSVAGMSRQEIEDLARMLVLSGDDPARMLKQITIPAARTVADGPKTYLHDPDLSRLQNAWRFIQHLRVNGMLSLPKTQILNLMTTAGAAAQGPTEMILGGIRKMDTEAVQFGLDQFAGTMRSQRNAWEMAWQSFKQGHSVLRPDASHFTHNMTSLRQLTEGGTAATYAEMAFSMPSRGLLGGDEFFTQINYDGFVYAQVRREAHRNGLQGEALEEFVERHMRFSRDPQNSATMRYAQDYALEHTFKAKLGPKGQAIENVFLESEALQAVHPFRRTLMNIGTYAWRRTPGLNRLQHKFRADLSGVNGELARTRAIGQNAGGQLAFSTAAALAFTGNLTGGGPSNETERTAWMGHNDPYTMTLGGVSVNLRRMGPLSTPMMIVADLWELSGELDDETYSEVASAIALSIADNMSESIFLEDMSRWMRLIATRDGPGADRFAREMAGTLVPNITRGPGDEHYREVRTMMDELKSRIWWYNDDVEPKRNTFGEPVVRPGGILQRSFNPMTISVGSTESEELSRELYSVGAFLSVPAPTKSFGEGENVYQIDMRTRGKWENEAEGRDPTQSPYDRWMELLTTTTVGDKTFKATLIEATESELWAQLENDQAKAKWVEQLRDGFLRKAENEMLIEYPSLRSEMIFARTQTKALEAGAGDSALQRNRETFGLDERGRWNRLRSAISGAGDDE